MKIRLSNTEDGKKLIAFLSEQIDGLTLSVAEKQIKLGEVRVNGDKIRTNVCLKRGDEVSVFLPTNAIDVPDIKILYNDDNIIVAYKPLNVDTQNNLVRCLKRQLGFDVVPVHRLDRNTEGIVVLAKDAESESILTEAIANRGIVKIYRALLYGKFERHEFESRAYSVKDEKAAYVKVYAAPRKSAKEIVTKYKVVKEYDGYSDVEIELVTGRTHQIRAHSAFLSHPVLGDGKYGVSNINKRFGFKTQQLKAVKVVFGSLSGKLEYLNGKEITIPSNTNIFD